MDEYTVYRDGHFYVGAHDKTLVFQIARDLKMLYPGSIVTVWRCIRMDYDHTSGEGEATWQGITKEAFQDSATLTGDGSNLSPRRTADESSTTETQESENSPKENADGTTKPPKWFTPISAVSGHVAGTVELTFAEARLCGATWDTADIGHTHHCVLPYMHTMAGSSHACKCGKEVRWA